jgi:hypothetical protein
MIWFNMLYFEKIEALLESLFYITPVPERRMDDIYPALMIVTGIEYNVIVTYIKITNATRQPPSAAALIPSPFQ